MRLALPEIEDAARLPSWLREGITGYLRAAIRLGKVYAPVVPDLARLLREHRSSRIVDLGSGGGGPWPELRSDLEAAGIPDLQLTLTDLHPNLAAAAELERHPGLQYARESVSALNVPTTLTGVRTMFTALHHLEEPDVRAVLLDAQASGTPFFAAEATHRSLRGLLVTLLVPVMVLLLMPRVTPRRTLPLLLTYLPPLLPLAIWWDGFASTCKTYRAEELRHITEEISVPGYRWTVAERRAERAPLPVTVVIGEPVPLSVPR